MNVINLYIAEAHGKPPTALIKPQAFITNCLQTVLIIK